MTYIVSTTIQVTYHIEADSAKQAEAIADTQLANYLPYWTVVEEKEA